VSDVIRRGGETYLRLETVARIYRVEVVWLREVVASGLLDEEDVGDARCIAAVRLDHVATIVRMHRAGLGLDAIRIALGV
jgi:hypothetical protein